MRAAAGRGAHGARVNYDQPLLRACFDSLAAQDHGLRHRRIAHAEEHALRVFRYFRWCRTDLPACIRRKLFRFHTRIRPERHLVSGAQ